MGVWQYMTLAMRWQTHACHTNKLILLCIANRLATMLSIHTIHVGLIWPWPPYTRTPFTPELITQLLSYLSKQNNYKQNGQFQEKTTEVLYQTIMITVQRTLSNEAMKILVQLYSARRVKSQSAR